MSQLTGYSLTEKFRAEAQGVSLSKNDGGTLSAGSFAGSNLGDFLTSPGPPA